VVHTTADLLRDRGLRVTQPRLAVLEALRSGQHVSAEDVARTARERLGTLSTQAVYDILHALVGAGLARRIEPAGAPAALYEARVGDNHHHVVCRECGRAEDVDCFTGSAPCLQPTDDLGFVVDEAEVTFWGRCPECRARESSRR
jgi:Fe2+ or Zn2+ uptake regulation protein